MNKDVANSERKDDGAQQGEVQSDELSDKDLEAASGGAYMAYADFKGTKSGSVSGSVTTTGTGTGTTTTTTTTTTSTSTTK